jgi:hypothetical protein
MNSLLKHLGWAADKAISVVLWLHHSVMLFLGLFWLMPLIALVVVSAFIYDLRPLPRESVQELALYGLLGLPPWFGLCLYAEFGMTRQAQRINDWMGRMPAYLGYVLLGVGGLLWQFGII